MTKTFYVRPLSTAIGRMGKSVSLLAMLAATPALAQYGAPAPQPMPQTREARPSGPSDIAMVHKGAACAVSRDRRAAAALLATRPFSKEEEREAKGLMRVAGRCVDGDLVTTSLLLRGAIAERLYEAEFQAEPATREPAVRALPLLTAAAGMEADVVSLTPVFALAECTATAQPGQVRDLLAADLTSKAEGAAFGALGPTMSSCFDTGMTFNTDRQTLRGILAESLYRWSVVQRDGAASQWAAAQVSGE